MKLNILGCYAATPRTLTNPTSQVLEIKNHLFLIDCGEGTQVQLRKNRIKFSRIDHIFISHLHGDHFFGLPGLISTLRLLGREKELHVYGPKGIKEGITLMLKLGDSWTNFPLLFHELSSKIPEVVFEDDNVSVETIPLDHRIYTNGFLFREKEGERKLNIQSVAKFKIDKAYFRNIKKGKDVTAEDGTIIPNKLLTIDPPAPKSYAFCSDTAYRPEIVPQIKEVDALYHESTFLQSEEHLTTKTKHATAKEAATIAKSADVGALVLGHYSTRYKTIDFFKKEAEEIFPNVHLADDGKVFEF
ncbi:ribonuclease Z [Euzebyella marina]|uniref:Ribonuclease Z n=1 Tax=Euzebyella marina TaxID=1761453 RepID=A0A3G2L4I5_9FLAO|nr:ribonuclease Z [Euzebyella marina]AYN67158.1 ribonuclease Z [Euzebyella marina]MAU70509.1 ribonuclease Z [Pseudozobellia sp.]|tara:strand:- start:53518 stop:54423 length:906 start_codon:yes stop_codon:yes gene_type:complete